MAFSIAFLDEPLCYPYDDPSTAAATGRLILGEWSEHFLASLYQWTKEDYEKQWRHAIKALIGGGEERSALITEYVSPESASHLVWWPMYLVGDKILVQNHLLFYEHLSRPFSMDNLFSFVPGRRTVGEDGEKISEWTVSVSEVEEFAGRL